MAANEIFLSQNKIPQIPPTAAPMKTRLISTILVFGCFVSSLPAKELNFSDVVSSVTLPDDWHVMQKQDYDALLSQNSANRDEETQAKLQEIIKKTEDQVTLILAASKQPPQNPTNNAFIQIMRLKKETQDKLEDPATLIDFMKKNVPVPGAKVTAENPATIELGGRKFLLLVFHVTLPTASQTLRTYFYTGQDFILNIQSGYMLEEDRDTLETILRSIAFAL